MYYSMPFGRTAQTFAPRQRLLAGLIVLSLLLQALAGLAPPVVLPTNPAATRVAAEPSTVTLPPLVDQPYDLPVELMEKPEIPALRTLDSATFDLGQGRLARVQDTLPLHYQDHTGQWQRINPAFQAVAGRWVNSTNSVRTALDPTSSGATINAAGIALRWQPQALELVSAAGARYTVMRATQPAKVQSNPSGTALRYQAGWTHAPIALPLFNLGTDEHIEEQWQSRPGSTEYTLRLTKLPSVRWWQATPAALELRVQLELQPGTTLKVDDQPVDLARHTSLTTRGPLVFADANGQELLLQPPVTYEQNNRGNAIQVEYSITSLPMSATARHSALELRVRTPWSWLAAPDRQFPVIIDPLFQMRRPYLAAEAVYKPSSPGAPYTFTDLHYVSDSLYLGRNTANAYRAALRFDLPLLPPGTQIDRAWLYVVPSGYKRVNTTFAPTLNAIYDQISAYAIQNANWLNGSDPALDLQAPLPPATQFIGYSTGQTSHPGVKWDVTSLAQSWLPLYGGIQPDNRGILLRLKNEFCDPNGVIFLPEVLMCGGFHFDLASDAWALHPDLENTQVNGTPDSPQLLASATGGIRLVVFYSNNTTLSEGATLPFFIPGNQLPQSLDKNPPYYYADHLFNVAPPPARWQAVVARSQGTPVGLNPPPAPGVNNSYRQPLSGAMSLDLRAQNDSFTLSKTAGEGDKVSYLLLNGRGAASPLFPQRLPLRTAFSPPPGAPLNTITGYDIRLIKETATINAPLGVKQEINYTFDSADPLALWNLQLPVGSNALVRIRLTGDGTRPPAYLPAYADQFEAKVIRSASQGDVRTSALNDNTTGQNATALRADQAISLDLDNVQNQPHALAIRYNGPQLTVRAVEECGKEFCDTKVLPVTYFMTIEVLACAAGSFPTNGGQCQKVVCPSLGSLAAYYRETSDYGLWSAHDWSSADESLPVGSLVGDTAPLLGPRKSGAGYRPLTVALIGGKIVYDRSSGGITVSSASNESEPAKVRLVQCPAPGAAPQAFTRSFPVFDGKLSHPTPVLGAGLRPSPAGSGQIKVDPWPIADRKAGDFSQEDFVVNPAVPQALAAMISTATGKARVRRVTGQNNPATLYFNASWSVTANGWESLSSTITADIFNPAPPPLASLNLALGSQLELDTSPANGDVARSFTAIRATAGSVTQPASLGGASKAVQMVILPRGVPIPTIDVLCPASCLDLRGPNDVANGQLDRAWSMPDIHTNVAANTVLMNAAGALEVYSTDHPSVINGTHNAISQEFSFDAYKATVTIDYAQCGGAGPEVLIIKGETRMALPNIGNTGAGGLIAAGFTLCESTLHGVKFNFESPIGVPIGNSGLFLTGIRGEVTIMAAYTQIKVGLNFQAAPGGDGGIFKAWGEVTIDTRGLFEFGGGGKVLGVVDADGRLWVAWNPLDTGFEVNVRLGSWFHGFARAHMWQGQGWQGRYSWLPANDEMHFAGEIGATITIEESAIMWLVPPGDIDIGIEVAFGQFCTNNSCTNYEWGIKGKVVVAGFDVGIYYGFDDGLDFILGNDNHLLIDEYGSQVVSAAASAGLHSGPAPQKVNATALIPFTVSPNAEQILVGLSWQAGTPGLSLINPDGVEINASNIGGFNGQTDGTNNITLLTLQQPQPGAWQARLSNLSEAGVEHYRFFYFANKGAPGPVGKHGAFLTPAQANEAGSNSYTITWQAPADTTDQATISLFYQRTLSDAAAIAQTGYITGNLLDGAPIVQNLPFKTGSFQWNTSGLLNGEYRIRAVVDDGINALPAGQVSVPLDVCQPQPNGLPTARAFDPQRFPGTVVFTSTGTIQINDVTPPAGPTGLTLTPADSALLAQWQAASDPDVSAYLVRWGVRKFNDPTVFIVQNQQLVAAADADQAQLYIGAVTNGREYGVDITALDSNGNASAQSAPVFATPAGSSIPVPLQPLSLTLASRDSSSATFTWQQNPIGPAPASYQATYIKLDHTAPVGLLTVNATTATIPNLQAGATYDVQVEARNSAGWSSAASARVRVVISNGVDANGDGLADDWASAHNVSQGAADADGDGLTNAQEFAQGSNPHMQDSDNDSASDGEEELAQTDPLDGSQFSNVYTQPRLALERNTLHFTTKLQAGGTAAPQSVGWSNVGGGQLQLQASSAASWILPTIVNDQVQVTLNPTGLAPGFHSGVVQLNAAPGSDPLIGEDRLGGRCLRVNAWVLPADNDVPGQAKQAQTISFAPLGPKLPTAAPFTVSAMASSGLPVSFASNSPQVCTVSGAQVTLVGAGLCTLVALQPGDANFHAAPLVTQSFVVGDGQSAVRPLYLPLVSR